MPSRTLLVAAICVLAAGCGDDIDDGSAGRAARDVIDGVELAPPDSPAPTTDPPSTDPPDDTTPDDTLPTFEPDDSPFGWVDFGGGVEEGSLEVPLDYADPEGATLELYVARHRALDPGRRIGTLLVNPGGPGFGGSDLAWAAEQIYGQELLDRFDIVGWDPRGTGFSEPFVDCIDDYDRYFGIDSSPDTPEERQNTIDLSTELAQACDDHSGDILPFVSTENSARDMDAIRDALGEDQISYFGFSYGSELGATWATMFPDTVRAAVLDGAADPTVAYLEQNLQQAAGFEAALTTFLAECSAERRCAFHNDGDAEGAFDELSAAVDAEPVEVEPLRTSITQGVLMSAVSSALYEEAAWTQLSRALADLQDGDGEGVLDLYDRYYSQNEFESSNGTEAYFAINCLDDPGSTGPDDLYTHEAEFAAVAPRMGRSWLLELTVCAVWTHAPAGTIPITGAGAGPILVMGTTGDTATPLEGTRRMAEALEDGHLVIVDANQHTGYGVNRCGDDTIDQYLVDPTAPLDDEIDCT